MARARAITVGLLSSFLEKFTHYAGALVGADAGDHLGAGVEGLAADVGRVAALGVGGTDDNAAPRVDIF